MTKQQRTVARGYGATHQALRKQWAPRVATGTVRCWRCLELITPNPALIGAGWDLGHDDTNRNTYRGPEHTTCNRGAPRRANPTPPPTMREW